MKRTEHNEYWEVERKSDERVHCNLLGYGEISQYDHRCCACWLGHNHTWQQHDDHLVYVEKGVGRW